MEASLVKEINEILTSELLIMLLFWKGNVYWLHKHYRKINFEESKIILLGKAKLPIEGNNSNKYKGGKTIYLTQPI